MKRIFLNDRFIIAIIILNACLIFAQETGLNVWWINGLDALCTLIFTIEMVIKHMEWGIRGYWKDGWNMLDGVLVILSLPSLVGYVWPAITFNVSFLLALRLLRVFRFFRVLHLFPNFSQIVQNLKLAFRQCFSVFVGFGVVLFIIALISCALFHNAAPLYFSTPIESLYSTFRMCTIEGWYDIPDTVCQGTPAWSVHLVRIYFVGILVSLGLIGMSIINSVFVDAMVSDNNDEVLKKLENLEQQIERLNKYL